jgi:hypothetical protein
MASSSTHGELVLWEMVIALFPQVMTRSWSNCMRTWIAKSNVFLHVQLLGPTHSTCSMPMSWRKVQIN